ncbi:hypothetical protein [Formosa algae]|nr:hypothetical protein [Formosa algae]
MKMKKILLVIIACLQFVNIFAQIKYEKGYFVDTSGNTIECYLKNNSNIQNSTDPINYKLEQDSEVKTINYNLIKEISIYNTYKFVKQSVEIGREDPLHENAKDFAFKTESLFLRVIIEGKANLYSYKEKGVEIFFFSTDILAPQQLIFKSYRDENYKAKQENRTYRKQLFENLTCEGIDFYDTINLKYDENDLSGFFITYNTCENSQHVVYLKKHKVFYINIRPRINSNSLTLTEIGDRVNLDSYDFENKITFGIGLEAEIILPFLNNKLAISIEPTYRKYNSKIYTPRVGDFTGSFDLNYSSIEIPLSLRHYSYLNDNSKIFLNASMVLDFVSDASIEKKFDDILINKLDIEPALNFAFGAGYKFKDKYSAEIRLYSKRDIVNQLGGWTSSYNAASLILGYTLF